MSTDINELWITEKPSTARVLAKMLGASEQGRNFLSGQGRTIVWCRGHILENLSPESYNGGKRLEITDLPMFPANWEKQPSQDDFSPGQVRNIRDLLKRTKTVVHAGDPDREGQIIVDEVLQFCQWRGPVRRLWLAAMDDDSVKAAIKSIYDNTKMANLSVAAETRSRADWLIGFNGSMALSRKAKAFGYDGKWSVGRVQTPVLNMVVTREEEIRDFVPRDYFQVRAHIERGIRAKWQIPETCDGLDEEGRLLKKEIADAVAARITGKTATVMKFTAKKHERHAPLPHALSTLQGEASRRFGMTAANTLKAAQALYDAGLTTYPRTDCSYLPEEQHPGAASILRSLGVNMGEVDPHRRHAAWNTAKVTAHHAIVPTGKGRPEDGSAEAKIFDLIADAYIRLFMAPEVYEAREAVFEIDGETFIAKSRQVLEPGWTALNKFQDEDEGGDEDGEGVLPILKVGDRLHTEKGEVISSRTKPPKYYTDGTLILAMSRVHTLVSDPKLKARLRETSGIGTEATRASMVEGLLTRGYIRRDKKFIRSADAGEMLIGMVRKTVPALADVGVTAVWEDALADIEAGKMKGDDFLTHQRKQVASVVEKIINADSNVLPMAKAGPDCPACKAPTFPRRSKAGTPFFACSNVAACGAAFANNNGAIGKRFGETSGDGEGGAAAPAPLGTGPACPDCGTPTGLFRTKTEKTYFRCTNSRNHGPWWDDKGALGKAWEAQGRSSSPPAKRRASGRR
jgi:DNA topoisomerase-3